MKSGWYRPFMTASEPCPVLIVMGSTRAGRRCPAIAGWLLELARGSVDLTFQLVDLRDWRLPADDEPAIPALGEYVQPHTRAWSEKIAGARAFVLLTPQYNWGYPAPLKNALDHLYAEWHGKPALIVTYGGHGGVRCAAQLRQVLEGLKMNVVPTGPALTIAREVIEGGEFDTAVNLAPFAATVQTGLAELASAVRGSLEG